MRNYYWEARDSARYMEMVLINLHGKDSVKPYYLAYNKKEFLLLEVSEVVYQYLLDLLFSNEYKEGSSAFEYVIDQIKNALKNLNYAYLDVDAMDNKENIQDFLNNNEKLMITAHSQGNIYFNGLYDQLLKNYHDSFRVVSVGSPVSINAPKSHSKMIIESSDKIKYLNGLGGFDENSLSNATNKTATGHSFYRYIFGSDTGIQMRDAYKKFFDDMADVKDKLSISIEVSDKSEFLVTEMYTENAKEIHTKSTYASSQWPSLSLPIRGELHKIGNSVEYSIGCKSFGENITQINMCVWNRSGYDINANMSYDGIYSNSISDTISYLNSSVEKYECVGYPLNIKNNGNGTFTIHD